MWLKSKFFTIALSAVNFSVIYGTEELECGSINVRDYQDLDLLNGCTVIVGFLALVFPMEIYYNASYTADEVNNRSFPLREVTEFMLVHNVRQLNSLGNMFPNLTVIRGQRLLSNHALVIYETDLREITLKNLLKVSRGSVGIDGINERLCLPEKIDWGSIIVRGKLYIGRNSISSNNCTWMSFSTCHSCPWVGDKCWHNGACQKFDSTYQPGRGRKRACHKLCIGECVNETASGCFTCQDLSEDSVCVEKCSEDKLLNPDSRRCVSIDECEQQNRTIHKYECLQSCPPGYSNIINITDDGNGTVKKVYCERCHDKCPKFCTPPELRSIAKVEAMGTGCTIIKGDLDIRLADDISNFTAVLQTHLGQVEEIWGSLKIHRSPSITELTFLNRLRVVDGKESKTAIQIFENQNLQKIFDWQARGNVKLKVKNGSIQVYRNILLCANETKRFQNNIERTGNFTDVIQNNGVKNKCLNSTIETNFHVTSHDSCKIEWKDANPPIYNAYIIQYVAIKSSKNVDDEMFIERDFCSSFGWQSALVPRNESRYNNKGLLEYNLVNLSQYTIYAFSVQTYQYAENITTLNQTESDGAISSVKTFRTEMRVPSRVRNLATLHKTSTSIALQWEVNESEESAIKFFYIDTVRKTFDQAQIDRRDYCQNPIEDYERIPIESKRIDTKQQQSNIDGEECCNKCCQAEDDNTKKIRENEDNEFRSLLLKLSDQVPRKSFEQRKKIKKRRGYFERFEVKAQDRNFTIHNLFPYSSYSFYLHACASDTKCSDYELHSEMTISDSSFDRVELNSVSYVFETENFHVHFNEPSSRNGAIVAFVTELKKVVGNSSVHMMFDCITRRQHEINKFRYSIDHLHIGTYSFRVMAVSLAGKGPSTDFHEFRIIEPDTSISKGWILLGAMIAVLIVAISSVSYYYKHKIITLLRRQSDRIVLMQDIEPTDFNKVSELHKYDDGLSDIMEFDDE